MRRLHHRQARGFSLVELALVMTIIGLLAAISLGEYTNFLARSKRAEVNANLRTIGRLEQMYEQDYHAFSPNPQVIGFAPERANRYAYIFKHGCPVLQDRSGPKLTTDNTQNCIGVDTFVYAAAPSTYSATLDEDATATELVVTAVGNLDTDANTDQWSLTANGRPSGPVSTDVSCASWDATPFDPCLDLSDT